MSYKRKIEVLATQLNQDTNIGGTVRKKNTWVVFENGQTLFYEDEAFNGLYESTVTKVDNILPQVNQDMQDVMEKFLEQFMKKQPIQINYPPITYQPYRSNWHNNQWTCLGSLGGLNYGADTISTNQETVQRVVDT